MDNRVEPLFKILQRGKLSRNSLFRLGVNLVRSEIEQMIKNILNNSNNTALFHTGGFHLIYTQPPETLQPNQVYLYVDSNDNLNATYLKDGKKWENQIYPTRTNQTSNFVLSKLTGNDTNFTRTFSRILKKIKNNTPLSSSEIQEVFKKIGTHPNPHPLLKIMDDYIFSMQQQRTSKHINDVMAFDKIKFTEALRTFVENPIENNWISVRHAMQTHPRYAFSWTGTSQVDIFLSFIKIQHQKNIQIWDDAYQAAHPYEAKTSWGHFIYNFGWIYYVPSFFLAPFKLMNALVKEYQRYGLQSELKKIRAILALRHQNSNEKASELVNTLEKYLSESDSITEADVTLMDEFEEHLATITQVQETQEKLRDVYHSILILVDRPIALPERPASQR